MVGLYEKNPKRNNTSLHAEKYQNLQTLPGEKIIKGRLVDVGDGEQILSFQHYNK